MSNWKIVPCKYCNKLCFYEECYNCFPKRFVPCQKCGEIL